MCRCDPLAHLAEALDSELVYTTGGSQNWTVNGSDYYVGTSSAVSGAVNNDGAQSWLETQVEGAGTVTFWWKSFEEDGESDNTLAFQDNGVTKDDGTLYGTNGSWAYKSYALRAGTHRLRWVYTRGSQSGHGGCGYVDGVTWDGALPVPPEPDPSAWHILTFSYDASGRRVEKKYDDDLVTKYVYDGDHCLAEYDRAGNLKRKYIYGPGIDQPICMIESSGDYAGTYYYHFDALGSVVALTDSSGDTVEVYEYDVYGRVGASDPNHPNRFMFTGREYDKETGLYYYRARYYNPQIGRFLQTDPIGYGDGMNWYAYCGNNPVGYVDPSGASYFLISSVPEGDQGAEILIRFTIYDDMGNELRHYDACNVTLGCDWLAKQNDVFADEWVSRQVGWKLSGGNELTFWVLQAINKLGGGFDYKALEDWGVTITNTVGSDGPAYRNFGKKIYWAPTWNADQQRALLAPLWMKARDADIGILAHELQHAEDHYSGLRWLRRVDRVYSQKNAIRTENVVMQAIISLAPKAYYIPEKYKPEDYLRPEGFPIDDPSPAPPWPPRRHRR